MIKFTRQDNDTTYTNQQEGDIKRNKSILRNKKNKRLRDKLYFNDDAKEKKSTLINEDDIAETDEEKRLRKEYAQDIEKMLATEQKYISKKFFEGKDFNPQHLKVYIVKNTLANKEDLRIKRVVDSEREEMQSKVLRTLLKTHFPVYYTRYTERFTEQKATKLLKEEDISQLLKDTIEATYQGTYKDVMYLLSRGGLIDSEYYLQKEIRSSKEVNTLVEKEAPLKEITTYISDYIIDSYVDKISVRRSTNEINYERDINIKQEYAPKSSAELIIEKNIAQYYRHADENLTYVKGIGIMSATIADGSTTKCTVIGYKTKDDELDLDLPYCEIFGTAILCVVDGFPKLFDFRTSSDANDFANKQEYVKFATYFYTESFKNKLTKDALREYDKMIKAIFNVKNTTVTKWLVM